MSQPKEPSYESQCGMVLAYLRRHGSITPAEAQENCDGCRRLAARIEELRKDGWAITSDIVYRGRRHWAKYTLVEEPQGVLSL